MRNAVMMSVLVACAPRVFAAGASGNRGAEVATLPDAGAIARAAAPAA